MKFDFWINSRAYTIWVLSSVHFHDRNMWKVERCIKFTLMITLFTFLECLQASVPRISSATRLTFITYGYKINFQSVLLHIRPGLALINLLSSNNINMPILNIVLHTILIILLERICLSIKTFHLEWALPLFSWPVCLIRLCYC